jgi:hypothetical protein
MGRENIRLKRVVMDLSLEKAMFKAHWPRKTSWRNLYSQKEVK